jgi:hypothetical protein
MGVFPPLGQSKHDPAQTHIVAILQIYRFKTHNGGAIYAAIV